METINVTLSADEWSTVRIAILLHAGEAKIQGRQPEWVAMVHDAYSKLASLTMKNQEPANGPMV